jgi:hypothetical protein
MIARKGAGMLAQHMKNAAVIRRSLEHRHEKFVTVLMRGEMEELVSGTRGAEAARIRAFSRRKPKAFPRLPINVRSGRLKRSIRVFRYKRSAGDVYRLQFTAPHSKFVLAPRGTKKMVPRGFWREMRKRAAAVQAWSGLDVKWK